MFYNKFYFMSLHVSSTMCSSSGGQNCITQHLVSLHLSFISCLYMFRAHVLIIRRSKLHYTASGMILFHASTCFEHHVLIIRNSKLHYTASGIITPIGGRLVHRLRKACVSQPVHETTTYRCDDTRCCITQF